MSQLWAIIYYTLLLVKIGGNRADNLIPDSIWLHARWVTMYIFVYIFLSLYLSITELIKDRAMRSVQSIDKHLVLIYDIWKIKWLYTMCMYFIFLLDLYIRFWHEFSELSNKQLNLLYFWRGSCMSKWMR